MALSLLDIITDYSPPNDQSGVPLKSTIEIQFDRLMDEYSIQDAFFLEGPDYDVVIGPNSRVEEWPNSSAFEEDPESVNDFLGSPGYKGIVQGSFSFETIDSKTKMIFTPNIPLKSSTSYVANINDIYTKSIGDVTPNVSNAGNGTVSLEGSWLGSAETININITESGVAGIAQFEWWKDSDPLGIVGPILTKSLDKILLQDGMYITFEAGTFEVDDSFTVQLTEPSLYEGALTFSFETGSGSIEALPTSGSSSVLSNLLQATGSASPLIVVKTTPDNHDAEIDPNLQEIVIEFNKNIDPSSVDDDLVRVITSVTSTHPSLAAVAHGELAKRITVLGKTIKIKI